LEGFVVIAAVPVPKYFQETFGFSTTFCSLHVDESCVRLIVKQPLFQKVPNEKHTADPPIMSNESLTDTTEGPIRSGLGVEGERVRVAGDANVEWFFCAWKKQTSFLEFSISSLTMPPRT
jgi:hypothetical protein